MNPTKQNLVDSITQRLKEEINARNPVKFLQGMDVSELVDSVTVVLYTFSRGGRKANQKNSHPLMAEVITAIGHGIRNRNKLKKDSSLAAKSGAFLLWSFEQVGIIKTLMGQANNKHGTFMVETLNEEALIALFEDIKVNKIEKLPSLVPFAPWTSTKHELGANMVKTADRGVLEAIKPDTHPMVYELLNKAQRTGWNINKDIYSIFTWALRNKTEAFVDIWDMQNAEAKSSKLREVKAVSSIAKRFLDETFFHMYYLDFR